MKTFDMIPLDVISKLRTKSRIVYAIGRRNWNSRQKNYAMYLDDLANQAVRVNRWARKEMEKNEDLDKQSM